MNPLKKRIKNCVIEGQGSNFCGPETVSSTAIDGIDDDNGNLSSSNELKESAGVPVPADGQCNNGEGVNVKTKGVGVSVIKRTYPIPEASSSKGYKPETAAAEQSSAPSSDTKQGKNTLRRLHCAVENCGYTTPFAKDLTRHMRKHTGEKPFKCDVGGCDKSYSRYDKLTLHRRGHDNVKPLQCSFCEYATVESGSLKKHLRVHTGERPWKCEECTYAAKESSQLIVHKRSHTNVRPYQCPEGNCPAAFKTSSDLKRHSGHVHAESSNARAFPCPHCEYKASFKWNLKLHVTKIHNSSKVPP